MDYDFGKRYEVPGDLSAADLIGQMTSGRLAPVYLLLEVHGDSELVSFERVDPAAETIDFERRGGEVVSGFPTSQIKAVTRVDPSRPVDRSDELGR